AQHFPPLECMWKGLWRRKTARRDGWVDVAGKALLPGRQAASPNVRSGMATCNHCGARISIHVSRFARLLSLVLRVMLPLLFIVLRRHVWFYGLQVLLLLRRMHPVLLCKTGVLQDVVGPSCGHGTASQARRRRSTRS